MVNSIVDLQLTCRSTFVVATLSRPSQVSRRCRSYLED
jgi:hypothetical protein